MVCFISNSRDFVKRPFAICLTFDLHLIVFPLTVHSLERVYVRTALPYPNPALTLTSKLEQSFLGNTASR